MGSEMGIFGSNDDEQFEGNPDEEKQEEETNSDSVEVSESENSPIVASSKMEEKVTEENFPSVAVSSNEKEANKKDSLLKQSIINYANQDKDSLVELLMMVDELIDASKTSSSSLSDDLLERKKANAKTVQVAKQIDEAKSNLRLILIALNSNLDKNEKVFDNFASDIEELVKGVDLSIIEEEISKVVKTAVDKIPHNEINNGVTTTISLVKKLLDSLILFKEDAKTAEEKMFNLRKNTRDILVDMESMSNEIRETLNSSTGKKFTLSNMLLVSIFSIISTLGGSVYFYEGFIGGKIDDLIDIERSSKIRTYSGNRGDYVLINKKQFKLTKSKNGETYKVYYKIDK